jgi:L-2-hydroxyglutarate oxidase LhgO
MQVMVIGAGVVGLAIAREAALRGHDVIVAEAASSIGTGTSSRNSEVIHAGLYYPTGSKRALHCPRGRRMLYAYCESHGIPHKKLGKLFIVTRDTDIGKLEAIYRQALVNGVENVTMLDAAEAKRMEPALFCVAAFHSAETGVIDSHRFMLALEGDIEDRGGVIAFNTPVERIARHSRSKNGVASLAYGAGWRVTFGGPEPGDIMVDAVVNSAGHGAQRIARAVDGFPRARVPKLVLAKGNYFGFAGRAPFSRLIYPAPVPGGLGIHITLDLAGRMRFGPDVEWIEAMNFDVDPRRGDAFYAAIRTYWPGLPDNSLFPDYAGIRPKLTGPGEPAADFMVEGPQEHGLPGLVHLFGIESPGLTSALSLAEDVLDRIGHRM